MDKSLDRDQEGAGEPEKRPKAGERYADGDPEEKRPSQGKIQTPCLETGETGSQLQGTQKTTFKRVMQQVIPAVLYGAKSILTDTWPPFIPHGHSVPNDTHQEETDKIDRTTDNLIGGSGNLNRRKSNIAENEGRDNTISGANLPSDDQASPRQAVIEIGETYLTVIDPGSSGLKVIQPNQQPGETYLPRNNLPKSDAFANVQVPSLQTSGINVPAIETSNITHVNSVATAGEGLSFTHAPSFSRKTPDNKTDPQPVAPENEQETIDQRFRNICETTQTMITQHESVYVSTFGQRLALKHLQHRGAIFMKGRSGSGKSRLGLRLLADFSRLTHRIPIVLTAAEQWRDIPQKPKSVASGKPANNYVVLIDDIFGSTNFVESRFDEWTRVFDVMHPSVESGHVMLVLTSRPDISDQCQSRLKKYKLNSHMFHLTLDEGEFTLRPKEKKLLLKRICQTKVNFTEEEINVIVQLKTTLGFPQCCHYFARSKQAQRQRVIFFLKPNEYVLEEVNCLQESDGLGYLVLLIVLFEKGYLDNKYLHPHKSPQEFKKKLDYLIELGSNLSKNPSLYDIQQKADSLCGVYLCHTGKGYVFQHQSIFEAVFINISQVYPDIYIPLCPANILVEFVRTSEGECENKRNQVLLNEEHHEAFADRITQLMLSEEMVTGHSILNHPSLRNETFVNYLVERWISQKKVGDIVSHKLGKPRAILEFIPTCYVTQILEVNTLLELFIITKNTIMFNILSERCSLTTDVLQCCLPCAIYVGSNILTEKLLAQGAKPNVGCFSALCVARGIATHTTERIFTNVWDEQANEYKHNSDNVPMLSYSHFSLAVLCGNYAVVKLLTDILKHERKNNIIFENSLRQLLLELQTTNPYPQFKPYDMDNLTKIMKILLNNYHANDTDYLCCLASAHVDASALKLILELNNTVTVESDTYIAWSTFSDYKSPFDQAAAYGGADCLEALLQHNRVPFINPIDEGKGSLLHIAARHGNTKCVQMLLRLGKPVYSTDFNGRTPLHWAVSNNHTECVKLLIDKGASIAVQDNFNETPLSSCTNIDIINHVLKSVTDIKIELKEELVRRTIEFGDLKALKLLCKMIDVHMGLEKRSTHIERDTVYAETVLHAACRHADMENVQYLCEIGANVHALDTEGETVIHAAAGSHFLGVEKLEYLLNVKKVPLHKTDNGGRTALFQAVISAVDTGDVEPMAFLIDKGLSVNHKDNLNRHTLLYIMIRCSTHCPNPKHFSEAITILLNAHVDTNQQDLEGRTALHLAIEKQNKEIVRLLLENGSNASQLTKYGETPLHYAAQCSLPQNDLDIMKLLLEHQTDVDAQNWRWMTALHLAVQSKEIGIVMLLLQQKVNLNLQDYKGSTALHFATQISCWPIASRLLDKGCDANIRDYYGKTALHYASESDYYIFSILLLLEKDVDINAQDKEGQTALHIAISHGSMKAVELLLEEGIDTMLQNNKGRTALHVAAVVGNDYVRMLLNVGVDPNVQDQQGMTALSCAIEREHVQNIALLFDKVTDPNLLDSEGQTLWFYAGSEYTWKLLLGKGAVPTIIDRKGRTALHYAARLHTNINLIKLLFQKGVNHLLKDHTGRTALHNAAETGCEETIHLLLEMGVDPSIKDETGKVALHYAACSLNSGGVKVLLEKGVNLAVKDNTGRTALHYAAQEGITDDVVLLLEKGCDKNEQDRQGKVALHYAAERKESDILKLLIHKGVNPSVVDLSGRTALHYAAMKGTLDSVKALLLKGVDANIQDGLGKTALHYATGESDSDFVLQDTCYKQTAQVLLESSNNVNITDDRGMTALHHAAGACKRETMTLLIEYGVSLCMQDQQGMTALHYAAEKGNIQCVKQLLQKDIDPSIQDNEGRTVLHCATKKLNKDIFANILQKISDPSIQDHQGQTAFHYAVHVFKSMCEGNIVYKKFFYNTHMKALTDCVAQLIEKGMDPSIQDHKGRTALEYVENGNRRDIIKELLE